MLKVVFIRVQIVLVMFLILDGRKVCNMMRVRQRVSMWKRILRACCALGVITLVSLQNIVGWGGRIKGVMVNS
jgi:hypothetical protein